MTQYLSTEQYKQALVQAQSQGIEPDKFLKTITDNGVVVQGYNDQQYKFSPEGSQALQSQATPGPNQSKPQGFLQGTENAISNFGVGLVKGTGQVFDAVSRPIGNAISNITHIGKGGEDATNQLNAQTFQPNGTSQKFGAAVGKTLPAVGAGLAGQAYLTGPLMAAGASPLVAGSLAQGAGAAVEGFAGTQGSISDRTKAGATAGVEQAAGNYVLGKVLPILGFGQSSSSVDQKAYNNAIKTVKSLTSFQSAINNESTSAAEILDETGANIRIPPNQMSYLAELADKYNIKLPETFASSDGTLTGSGGGKTILPSDSSNLLMQMGKAANKSGYPTDLMNAIDQLQNNTVSDLNAHSQGLGDEFGRLYTDWRARTDIMKPAFDIFQSEKAIPSPQLEADIRRYNQLTNTGTGQHIATNIWQNIKDIGGPDLTSEAKAIQAVNQIKNPATRTIAMKFLKGIGLVTAGAALGEKAAGFLGRLIP